MYSVYLNSRQIIGIQSTCLRDKTFCLILSGNATFCILVVFLTYHWMSMSLMDTRWNSHDKMIKDKYIILKFHKKNQQINRPSIFTSLYIGLTARGVNSCHIVNVVRTLALYIINLTTWHLFSLTYFSLCPLYFFQAQHYH